jgi:4-amino-4-deoxy-L-arabinose transferase-like glycosyltransferase
MASDRPGFSRKSVDTNLFSSIAVLRRSTAAASTRQSSVVGAWILEAGLLLSLGIFSLALRFPHYQTIPAFTDETDEIYQALLVARGQLLPLTNATPIIGSLWNYVVAAAFWLSGFSLYAPRTVTLVLGVLTVLATYPLGKAWGGQTAGFVAATLMATAAGHVVINSHVAWSNSMTPLFTTLAVWTLYSAVQRMSLAWPKMLLLSGGFWGLAVQSHPSALALLPGAAIFLVWRGWPLLRGRWPYLAAGLFLLANLNLLVYNLASGFDSVSYGVEKTAEYAREQELTPAVYLERMALLLLGLLQHLGGAVDLRRAGSEFLLDPGLWPVGLLSIVGVWWQWRRGNPLPALLLGSAALVLPLFNGKYNLIPNGRYLTPLLPIVYAAVGVLVADGIDRLRRSGHTLGSQSSPFASLGAAALVALLALIAFVAVHPLSYLPTYYRQVPEIGWTNAPILQTFELIQSNRQSDGPVILDRSLNIHRPGWGDGTPLNAFEFALNVNDLPYFVIDLRTNKLLDPTYRCQEQFVVLATRDPRANEEIVRRLDLQHFQPQPAELQAGTTPIHGLYVLKRLPDAPTSCN